MILALKSGPWFGVGFCRYFTGSKLNVNIRSTMSPATSAPPTALASGTVIDIARKFGEPGAGAPSWPMKDAGMTTKAGFFGSAYLLGRIGSPIEIGLIEIFPP